MQQHDTEGGIELTRLQAHADASFIVLAGSDTVSEAMTALMRYIAADAEIQRRLRSELRGAFDGQLDLDMDASTLLKLPYLDACVQEALRLVPPVAAGKSSISDALFVPLMICLTQVLPVGTGMYRHRSLIMSFHLGPRLLLPTTLSSVTVCGRTTQ